MGTRETNWVSVGCGTVGQDGKTKKWVVDTSKGSSNYVPGAYSGAAAAVGGGGGVPATASGGKRTSGVFDPAQ